MGNKLLNELGGRRVAIQVLGVAISLQFAEPSRQKSMFPTWAKNPSSHRCGGMTAFFHFIPDETFSEKRLQGDQRPLQHERLASGTRLNESNPWQSVDLRRKFPFLLYGTWITSKARRWRLDDLFT